MSLPHWSASDTIARRQGGCRDRAHAVVALCRAFNRPAHHAVSYLPDIDVSDDGIPMDFHAYAEVWLEGGWQIFDPHDRFPRKGRVFIASGLDAADAAFATLYGAARLTGSRCGRNRSRIVSAASRRAWRLPIADAREPARFAAAPAPAGVPAAAPS